jgi:hypothetical protein
MSILSTTNSGKYALPEVWVRQYCRFRVDDLDCPIPITIDPRTREITIKPEKYAYNIEKQETKEIQYKLQTRTLNREQLLTLGKTDPGGIEMMHFWGCNAYFIITDEWKEKSLPDYITFDKISCSLVVCCKNLEDLRGFPKKKIMGDLIVDESGMSENDFWKEGISQFGVGH